MLSRWTAFTLWALVAGSAVFWGLRLFVQPQAVPAGTVVATTDGPLRGDLSRLLGAEQAATEAPPPALADPRFQLLGVLSARGSLAEREGVALIAVDDRPPRAYRVGMVVDGDTVLQAVHPRGARLGPSGGLTQVALELPPPAAAATGNLPDTGETAPSAAAAGPAGTQIFRAPGQPAPSFTRMRSPAANAPAPVLPPPGALALPAPPPPMLQDVGEEHGEVAEPAQDIPNQTPYGDPNPIR